MTISNAFETDLAGLIFNATSIAGLADNSNAPIANLFIALHTTDPGEAGDQTTNEISYTGYARVNVARTTAGWVVANNTAKPAATVSFGIATAGGGSTASFCSVGTSSSGTGKILFSGAISPVIPITTGKRPLLTTASVISFD